MGNPEELVRFLAPYPRHVQELTLDGRQFLLDLLMPVREIHWDATQAVCAGFLYTDKSRDSFVNFATYANHVTLVFQWGVRLSDPEGRLNGSGNQVRHLRLAGMETLRDPYVLDLIREAADLAPRPEGPVEHAIIVKVMQGPKRRPSQG